jgi:four helix bundle protein
MVAAKAPATSILQNLRRVRVQDFRRLQVWQRSHQLAIEAYRVGELRSERRFPGLMSQIRRAASAIPANIAEGCGHSTQQAFARFLQISLASAHELQYHLQLAHDLGAIAGAPYAKLDARTEQVKQMLTALLRTVRSQPRALPPRA